MNSATLAPSDFVACPDCDKLLEKQNIPDGKIVHCPRCGSKLHSTIANSLQKAIALSFAGLVIYIPAITLPIMTFTVSGLKGSGSVVDATLAVFEGGYYFVGLMVLLVSIVFPFLKLGLLFICSVSIACGHVSKNIIGLFRLYNHLSEWGMVEVYMLGILVSIIKMYSMAMIHYDLGFFCFIGLVLLTIWSSTVVDDHRFWILIEQQQKKDDPGEAERTDFNPAAETAREAGLVRCHDCGKLSIDETVGPDEVLRCPRCRAALHVRKPGSLSRTWALVLAALILYLPANILPMMRVNFMGNPDDSTILDGIIYFFQHGEYLVGGIILTASVLVPLFKIIGIILILLSIRFHWNGWLKHKSVIFRFIEFIGRWSFLDVFVIALLAAMVRFGALTTIEADPAAPYFTAVVVCTMFAALSFDPRIMWDIGAAPTKSED
jgi:paraquat-inducible protein A